MKLLSLFHWICLHLCYWKKTACHFPLCTQVILYELCRVQSLPRHTGGSFTGWLQGWFLNSRLAQAEAPNWIASGVILTCSVTVKSQMFWFILSPLFICLGLFSAMKGFSTKGLDKVGPVYSVDAGRKWCQGISSVTWQHRSKTHLCAHAHTVTFIHTHTILHCIHFIAPASCYQLHKWLFILGQHVFLIFYCVIKAA